MSMTESSLTNASHWIKKGIFQRKWQSSRLKNITQAILTQYLAKKMLQKSEREFLVMNVRS